MRSDRLLEVLIREDKGVSRCVEVPSERDGVVWSLDEYTEFGRVVDEVSG